MQNKIRVGLLDADHYRRWATVQLMALTECISIEFESCEVLPLTDRPQIDVLVLAHSSPGQIFGPRLQLDCWQQAHPKAKIILMTSCSAHDVIRTIWNSGLDGCIIFGRTTPKDLIEMIAAVANGEHRACVRTKELLATRRAPVKLSPRELEMIRLIGELGPNSRKQIAHRMGFTPNCYSVRMRRLAAKFDVAGSDEVVQRCLDLGLIEMRSPLALFRQT